MRTIGFFIITMLLCPSFPSSTKMLEENILFVKPNAVFRLHLPAAKYISPIPANKQQKDIDTNQLKQSSWYANAIHNIQESEYEIKPQGSNRVFAAPNRQQNLRASYTADQFNLAPGGDDSWELQLTLKGVYSGNKKIYAAQQDAVAITEKNKIRFNHNNEFNVEYINSKEGIRQNFIIEKEPAAKPKTLNIKLSIGSCGQINQDWLINKVHSKEIHFAKTNSIDVEKKLTYNDLKVWDATNKELAAHFEVEKNEIEIVADVENAIYPVTIDPLSTTANWTAEGNQASGFFGCSVASAGDVNGDGYSDVIVGAYQYANGQLLEGAAFIFHGSITGLSATAQTQLEINQINAGFGFAVSSAGDVNGDGYSDVIVGAYAYDSGEIGEGAAFVYLGAAAGINPAIQAQLESNQPSAGMGYAVSCAGDVNGDGYSDVIASAPDFANGQIGEGAAFVYHGSNTGISNIIQAQFESNQVNASLGASVSSAGDVNGDGYSDVIAGVTFFANGQADEGAAFIYHGSAGGINTTIQSQLESNQAGAQMGISVSAAGDINGDGYGDVIVSAHEYTGGQASEGAAFIYLGSSFGINTTAQAVLESDQAGALMGISVAAAGDVNGDGYCDVMVGAFLYDNGQNNEGAVFIYHGSVAGINITVQAQLEINQANANLGASVSPAGDVDGDGYSDVIVGATLYDNGQTNEGGAFVYHGSAEGINVTASATMERNQASSQMGYAVASAGDVNGDGYSDVIVGANLYDSGEGAAFVYHGSPSGISSIAAAMLESNNLDASMGSSVASAGDVNGDGYGDVIVGAPNYSNGQFFEGAAFLYHGSPAGINTTATAILETNQLGASMGRSVAGAGDVNGDGYSDIIVGAALYSNGQSDEGIAFIYHGSATGINTTAAVMLERNQADAYFGFSVAGAGDVNGDGFGDVAVGANFFDNGQTNEGAVFVYHGSTAGINATPAVMLESNQMNAHYPSFIAEAGDVNGDGFSDIIAGTMYYDNGQMDEGAAFIYHGSPAGVNSVFDKLLESNQAFSGFGLSVAAAGDVNGDSYSDVVVGSMYYDNGENDEGAAFVYHGSATGINIVYDKLIESNHAIAYLGCSVAGAGDVNGDGCSDIIAGAYGFDNGQTDEGAAFLYHGNNASGSVNRNNLRLYNSDLVTPIQQANMTDPNLFGAGLYAKSFLGKQKGKLVWETVKNGNPFSGSPITNSTAYTSQAPAFTDLGLTGIELKKQIAKQVPAKGTYIRARVKYDLTTAITGQVYGPWRYPEGFLRGRRDMGSVPLPVKFIAFTASRENEHVLLKWITTNEIPGIQYEVQHSTDGMSFVAIKTLPSQNGNHSEYEWLHPNPGKWKNYYRIRAVENGKDVFTVIRQVVFQSGYVIKMYPSPVKSGGTLMIEPGIGSVGGVTIVEILDIKGQKKARYTVTAYGPIITVPLPQLATGQYILRFINSEKTAYTNIFLVVN